MTHTELLALVENDQIVLVNSSKEDCKESIENYIKFNFDRGRDIANQNIGNKYDKDGLITIGEDFCIVMDDETPLAIICQYELSNPFIFDDIVVCPGHDSITCFNKKNGRSKTEYIR